MVLACLKINNKGILGCACIFLLGIFKTKLNAKISPSVNNGITGTHKNRLGFCWQGNLSSPPSHWGDPHGSPLFCDLSIHPWILALYPRRNRRRTFQVKLAAGTEIKVTIALATSFSRLSEMEKTSDSETLIFRPLFTTFERQTMRSPTAGLKKLILNSMVRIRNDSETVV